MTKYTDFLLNELVGKSGLDFDQTAEVIHQSEELLEETDEATLTSNLIWSCGAHF
jgi:hypothetical protein